VGGDYGWQAVGTAANTNIIIDGATTGILALDAAGTAAAGALTALGSGASITVPATAGNLAIGASTEIALGGTFLTKKWGEITLVGDATAGKITFTDDTSTITTGNNGTGGTTDALADDAVTAITGNSGPIGIVNVLGDNTNAQQVTTTAAVDSTGELLPAGYLVSLVGNATTSPISGGLANNDGKISAETETVEDNT
jgi:hypothetical protein